MSELFNKLNNATTSGDIAYARGELKNAPLKKKKKKPKHMTEQELQEETQAQVDSAKRDVTQALREVVNSSKLTDKDYTTMFPAHRVMKIDEAMISKPMTQKDYARIEKNLPEDLGELQMITTAIRDGEPLNKFEAFDKKDKFLYGVRVFARFEKQNLVYEGLIDFSYTPKEYIYTNSIDVLEAVADGMKRVKVSGKYIYPQGSLFDPGTYKELIEIIRRKHDELAGVKKA